MRSFQPVLNELSPLSVSKSELLAPHVKYMFCFPDDLLFYVCLSLQAGDKTRKSDARQAAVTGCATVQGSASKMHLQDEEVKGVMPDVCVFNDRTMFVVHAQSEVSSCVRVDWFICIVKSQWCSVFQVSTKVYAQSR
jgi:hypothetical protein